MPLSFDEEKQNKRLDELKRDEEENLLQMLAETQFHVPYIDLTSTSIDNDALRILSETESRQFEVGPFNLVGKKLSLAVHSPTSDGALQARTIAESRGYAVSFFMASRKSIEKVWSRYKDLSYATTTRAGGLDISQDVLVEMAERVKTTDDAIRFITQAIQSKETHAISRILETILGAGIALGASDVHIEPEADFIRLRYRLDGVLYNIMNFDAHLYQLLNSRVKLLSGLKLTVKEVPQDGRFSSFMNEAEINYRTSLIPGAYGESIVLRILNPKSIQVNLDELGISPELYEIFMREIKKPNGMILLTGPTGSGKTTTLYAFLQKIYTPEIKVITIEDPIEYHLPGITQTQTDHKKGYTFLEGLRSALRQDPDVIMVGEIRDPETAKIAVESALTGHLVFSTLHTNNASGVIPRLIDLDVNPKILVSALGCSIAQRLCRKLCTECKYEREVTAEEKVRINTIWEKAAAEGKDLSARSVSREVTKLWSAKGCPHCNNTGYKGRVGIFEAILTDEAIEKIIMASPTERDIKKASLAQGILDMKEDGLVKILKGITDFPEVMSVVDITED
ncbi:MAG TPA: GspE/PulE family protein [Candidatus Paceibacterota bacterium]|nr:GspE/PulE family protein [Candidatus Paceibacterota bacterium]